MTTHSLLPKGFNPFVDLIGVRFTLLEGGRSRCVLEVRDDLFNPNRVLHGGAIYTMADTGMGAALHTDLQPGETTATIEIKISYFRPVTAGTLVCETRIVHRGRRVATLESDVHNDGRLVARASGTFYIFTKEQNRRGS